MYHHIDCCESFEEEIEMSVIHILSISIIAALLAGVFYLRHRQKRLLQRLGKMLEDVGNGRFQPQLIDESMISSIENSMKRFLADSILSEENLQEQKGRIPVSYTHLG